MKPKNTLVIAVTKLYEVKVEADQIDLAYDEFMNTNPKMKLVSTLRAEPEDLILSEVYCAETD